MSKSNTSNQKTRQRVYNKYGGRCAYCGHPIEIDKFQVDHIIPKIKITSHKFVYLASEINHIDNYNPSCGSCNSSKSTFTIEQWRNELMLKKKRIVRDSATFRILFRFKMVSISNESVKFYFETHG